MAGSRLTRVLKDDIFRHSRWGRTDSGGTAIARAT